jgi:hypothetical protein
VEWTGASALRPSLSGSENLTVALDQSQKEAFCSRFKRGRLVMATTHWSFSPTAQPAGVVGVRGRELRRDANATTHSAQILDCLKIKLGQHSGRGRHKDLECGAWTLWCQCRF